MAETTEKAPGDPKRIPKPALVLGLGGLIPFAAGAFGVWQADPGIATAALHALAIYGAVILSFLGGVHWGRALAPDLGLRPGWARLLWAVTPALLAWASVVALPFTGLIAVLIAGFVLAFFVDIKAVAVGMFPPWYGTLRKILSIGVLACLALALMGMLDGGRGWGG